MKKKHLHILFGTCASLWAAFIWSNSLVGGVKSGQASGNIVSLINNIFKRISLDITLTHYFIRKSAHFLEYALLGVLIVFTLLTLKYKFKYKWIFAVSASLSVACIDELIQHLTPGRSCELTDVLIDFSGALSGIILLFIIFQIQKLILSRKKPGELKLS